MPFPGEMPGRWVSVAPPDQDNLEVVLQPPDWGDPSDIESRKALAGKAPGFVVTSDDCRAETEALTKKGVKFTSPPEEMPWGISAVFVDPYGHEHNLLQPFAMDGE